MGYKFVKTKDPENKFDKTNVSIEVPDSDSTIEDIIEAFTEFLQAAGFSIKLGEIEYNKQEEQC